MKQLFYFILMNLGSQVLFAKSTSIKVLSQTDKETIVEVNIGDFTKIGVNTPQGIEYKISIDKGTQLLFKGEPDIPKLAFSLLIPNQTNSTYAVLESYYTDYTNMSIAPSKGSISRDINPSTIPFIYGDAYQTNEFFPNNIVGLNDPFVFRDYRGQTIMINPIQYNPVSKIMRVYSSMKVKIEYSGVSSVNTISNNKMPQTVVDEFDGMYKNRFINYNTAKTRYTGITEQGSLLILCPALYLNELAPFVDWKERKGFKTYLVNTDTISGGVNENTIKNLAKWYFQNKQIAYMLIVGDQANIPVCMNNVKGASDIAYAYVNGNDHHPEFIVGRFSGESALDIQTQVNRSIEYEFNPNTGSNWMRTQIGLGSDDATTGDENQYDWQHIHEIVDSNKNQYNYITNKEMYDGSAPKAGTDLAGDPDHIMMRDEINNGASLINYCGHGGWDGIVTSHFSILDVPDLVNTKQLPFFLTVGCQPGNFVATTSFSESLQRATSSGNPVGSIANFMATINQYWDEPMQAQDEFNAILRGARPSNLKSRLGAMCVDACMSMCEQYDVAGNPNGPLAGSDMTDTWVFFGDPTISIFTKDEGTLTFTNDFHIQQNSTTFTVNCPVVGAQIGLYYEGKYLASAISNGGTCYFSFPAITNLDTVFITATKQNYTPAFGFSEVVNWPNGVQDISVNNELQIFPNPTNDQLHIHINDRDIITNLQVIDLNGKIVFSENIHTNEYKLQTKDWASGNYVIRASKRSSDASQQKVYTSTFTKK